MSLFMRFFILGILILVQSCTGQKPAKLKSSTSPRKAIRSSCSHMVFEGQVLSKKNVLNILDCSGWSKQYPDLNLAIQNADESSVNHALKVFNDSFFSSKSQRKAFYELTAESEFRGELGALSKLLGKSLTDHKILSQVDKALNKDHLDIAERSDFMKVFSNSNDENLKLVTALKHLALAYEMNKSTINSILSDEEKDKLVLKFNNLLSDFSKEMDAKSWNHLAKIIYSDSSAIQKWAVEGLQGDLRVLLNVIEEPGFYKDISFLKNSLHGGIECTNRASSHNFNINVAQELKQKIEGLKSKSKSEFEQMLLHGLTKYLAFQEFCEEKSRHQGVTSFFKVIKHAFSVLPSHHDYQFLKRIHQLFGSDRYVFLSFLSSKSFASLRELLIDLKAQESDEEFVRSLYDVLAHMPEQDLEAISELMAEISTENSKSRVWFQSWAKLWDGLANDEREEFIRFLGTFLSEDIEASKLLHILENIFLKFPQFSEGFSGNLETEKYQQDLRYLIHVLSGEKVQQDLSSLLSDKGLFEFISIMTQEYEKPVRRAEALDQEAPAPTTYVSDPETMESVQTKACFASLSKTYEENSSYYHLVNNLPESCLNILGEVGFVGQIYLWMNSSDAFFREHYQVDDFHSATGVWAPGMLQFIFSSAVKADFALTSENGKKGILENLDSIHSTLVDPRLLETIHQFSNLYKQVDTKLDLDPKVLKFMNERGDKELNQLMSDGFSLLENSKPFVELEIKPTSCSDLSSDLGANPCMGTEDVKKQFVDMVRILKRPNEKNNTLMRELIKLLHPEGGIPLPFGKRTTHTHKATLDELIRFLNDLSSEKTSKEFTYVTPGTKKQVRGTVLDRLEVVIRDIEFVNNFYGAFFKNDVASAQDYRKDVIASEKLLVLLDRSGGIFRTFNGLPRDSKYRLKNVRSTYSSLVEVSNEYPQADGTTRNYGPLTQSLLAMIASSSKVSTQDFNPYRVPSEKVVEGHNGWFLTKTVQMSGLRHLAAFVRSHFDEDLTALDTETFKKINKNLIARHDLNSIQDGAQNLLDQYLDNDRKQINMMIDDAVDLINEIRPEEQKVLEEIILKGLVLLSDERISTANIKKSADMIELTVKLWPEIREIFLGVKHKRLEVLKLINEFMDNLVQHPEEFDRLVKTLMESDLMSLSDLEGLLFNQTDFVKQVTKFLNQLILMRELNSDLNWHETLKAIFTQEDFEWEALKTWFQVAMGDKDHKLSVSLLIEFIGEKDAEGYRFERMMDELFKNHREKLEDFLRETFKALEIKPDQINS